MDMQKSKKLLYRLAIAYWVLVIMIYAVAHEQFRFTRVKSEAFSPLTIVGEITDGMVLTQEVVVPCQRLEQLEVMTATYDRTNQGTMQFVFVNASGNEVARASANIAQFENNAYTSVTLEEPLEGYSGQRLILRVTTQGCLPGSAASVYMGNLATNGRFHIEQKILPENLYQIDGERGNGSLCIRLSGVDTLAFYKVYWVLSLGLFVIAAAYACWGLKQAKAGKHNPITILCTVYNRYGFLLHQLVLRDFKSKYKRSALGMCWSFLNPLLTMLVQYVIFSTVFKSNTANYPVYLLSGIVFFNFFSEAVSLGMTSITNNASLIKKVYIPKYIFPFSRLFSSLINFGMAMIPLFLVMLFTGTPLRPSILLLVFDVLCLMCFVLGMILLLSTAMTFFQDTQFLWSVVSMLWMYLTPLFYPETIIPQSLRTLYRVNPMYQYITFARTCIIDGISPAPTSYLWCILSAAIALLLGVWAFKKHQNKFVLYL